MAILNTKQVLKDNKTNNSNSITSLTLTFKALSDVSCLSDFNNLEKLDLTFNSLSSLEALKECVNLKWLSVVQNKLRSLKGIERLTKLTVLNAGKNKLNSMDEVTSVITLRALILNDNEITSIPKLDRMKELNTLVLSRNPIQEIGESMEKLKLISKISLSHCQIQTIGSSLKSCTELRELRLAHNSITNLPDELVCNKRIRILDIGNNFIGRWSNLKVLSSLSNLRNLDLQGNPVAEKKKLARKIKKLVPSLQIYNAKPMEKIMENEDGRINDSSADAGDKPEVKKPKHLDHTKGSNSMEHHVAGPSKDTDVDGNQEYFMEKKSKGKRKKGDVEFPDIAKKRPTFEDLKQNGNNSGEDGKSSYLNPDIKNNLLPDKHETKESSKKKTGEEVQRKKRVKNVTIDDGEIPFSAMFTADITENAASQNESLKKSKQEIHSAGEVVTFPKNKKKIKRGNVGASALQSLLPANEIGLGGPSAWDD
ncbi:uncharacterized protein LOC141724382 [Apium graveolens]|uniref:uncharacterized protein LOC141724382 n=1 Tax=Apium graveolens TaxID=4045 RepID=UPI003D7A0D39